MRDGGRNVTGITAVISPPTTPEVLVAWNVLELLKRNVYCSALHWNHFVHKVIQCFMSSWTYWYLWHLHIHYILNRFITIKMMFWRTSLDSICCLFELWIVKRTKIASNTWRWVVHNTTVVMNDNVYCCMVSLQNCLSELPTALMQSVRATFLTDA